MADLHLLRHDEAKKLLHGLPLVPTLELVSEAMTRREAAKLLKTHAAVVIKADSPKLLHKVEVGVVAVNLKSVDEAAAAYCRVSKRAFTIDPRATITLQPMLSGVEVILGVKRDATFGPVVLFGVGGTLTNVYKDFSLRLAPVTKDEARAMLDEITARPLLEGYRGSTPVDTDALAAVIAKLSHLAVHHPEIAEIDLNPVVCDGKRVMIVDAKLLRSKDAPKRRVAPSKKELARASEEVRRLLNPRSIAVIGASRDAKSVGHGLMKNLLKGGQYATKYNVPYHGPVYPVNPHASEIEGLKAYPSLKAIPAPVDLAIIAVPAPIVPEVVRECVEKSVQSAVIISAGFAELGEKGRELQQEVLDVARGRVRVLGPNCLGFIVPRRVNASFAPADAPDGGVAFLSQSGAIVDSVVDWADQNGYGFSAIVSMGNAADLQLPDLLEHFAHDSHTKAAAVYLEGVADGQRFLEAAARFTRRKPLVVLKGGKTASGSEAISSHTGSLAGSYDVYKAAFRKAGIVEAETITELFMLAAALQEEHAVPKRGKGVAVITNAGGVGVILSDACAAEGVPLCPLDASLVRKLDKSGVMHPAWSRRNPLDLVGDALPDRYHAAVNALLESPDVSGLIVAQTLQTMTEPEADAQLLIDAARHTAKPVVACFMGGLKTKKSQLMLVMKDLPCFNEPYDAVRAMKGLLARARKS